jgi:uncharacterized NAD(P)/FAD-binding protein YdhS
VSETTTAPVAIIGGGFSGAAVAWHLLRLRPELSHIIVIEPRKEIGRGLAYSAADPSHRINVPAARMSLIPDEPDHFNDWLIASGHLDADPAAHLEDGRNFPARAVFGEYVHGEIIRLGAHIRHVQACAEEVVATPDGYAIRCSNGASVHAGIVVLAVCHVPPSAPAPLEQALAGDPRFIANPWTPGVLDAIAPDAHVLIVGSGLTMADIVASLDRNGHRGEIVAVSRRGLRSRGHPSAPCDPYGDFATNPSRTVRALVRRVREAVRDAAREGKSWHGVLDQVRLQGSVIWGALSLSERRRLLRHLRPFWDVHRFRIAPQIEATLDRRAEAGSFTLRSASLRGFAKDADGIAVTLRDRRTGSSDTLHFDAVVLATGPAHGRVFADSGLLGALEAAGLARPDPLRLGIEVDQQSRALGANGTARDDLFVAGPLARGTFGELMGLPDVTNHAIRVAAGVAKLLQQRAPRQIADKIY